MAELVAGPAAVGVKLAAIGVIGTTAALIAPAVASAGTVAPGTGTTAAQAPQAGTVVAQAGTAVPQAPQAGTAGAPAPPAPASAGAPAPPAPASAGGSAPAPQGTPPYPTLGGVPAGDAFAVRGSYFDPVTHLGGTAAYISDPTGQTDGYVNLAAGLGFGGVINVGMGARASTGYGVQVRSVNGPVTVFAQYNMANGTLSLTPTYDTPLNGAVGGTFQYPMAPGGDPASFVATRVGGWYSLGAEQSVTIGGTFAIPKGLGQAALQGAIAQLYGEAGLPVPPELQQPLWTPLPPAPLGIPTGDGMTSYPPGYQLPPVNLTDWSTAFGPNERPSAPPPSFGAAGQNPVNLGEQTYQPPVPGPAPADSAAPAPAAPAPVTPAPVTPAPVTPADPAAPAPLAADSANPAPVPAPAPPVYNPVIDTGTGTFSSSGPWTSTDPLSGVSTGLTGITGSVPVDPTVPSVASAGNPAASLGDTSFTSSDLGLSSDPVSVASVGGFSGGASG